MNGWANSGEAGDLRRYRAYYDVTVMINDGFIAWGFSNLPDPCNKNIIAIANWIWNLVSKPIMHVWHFPKKYAILFAMDSKP